MPLDLNSFIFSMIILINMALASLDEPEKVTMMDAIDYLQKYGYVRHSSLVENASNNSIIKDTQTIIKRSIAEFQETAGLPKTGNLDIKTKEMFTAPRCAFTDFHAQSEFDVKWEKNDLVYTILNYSPDLTRVEIREAIAAAFAKWSAVIPLNFKEVDQDGDHIDINIGFYRKRHGDNDPFDGEGGALAHALWPPSGNIHFDDDEKWAYKNEEKILLKKNNKYVYRDLLQTAIHEIGHAIGLEHVRRNDSIMKTFYDVSTDSDGRYKEPQLFQSDIEKIQERYGARITASPQTSEPKEKPFTRNGFYAARRGDTAKTIADVFDISIDDLKTFNPQLNINKINPGKWIRVIEDRKPDTDKIEQPITTTSRPSTTSVPSTKIKQPITTTSKPSTKLAQPITTTSIPITTTPELFQKPEENNLPSTEKPFTGQNDGCHDANLCCSVWVQQGLCEGNPDWMSENCRLSCGYCIAFRNYRDSSDCYDKSNKCFGWSRRGECVKNPDYMLKNCRQSCRVCISLAELQLICV